MSFTAATGDMAQPAAEPKRGSLGLRLASAAILAPVVVGLTVLGGWPFALLVAFAGVLMGLEWDRMTGGRDVDVVASIQAGAPAAAALAAMVSGLPGVAAVTALAALALAAVGRSRGAWPPLGAFWLALPCGALVWLRDGEAGLAVVLWVLLLVWSADTLAYVFGRLIGGPRLAPRISPKKTWAGLLGAVVGASLVGAAGSALTGLAPLPAATAASGLAGALSQVGDLAESAVKRRFGVKDSGALIPGHGGILDRVDALLFATLAAAGLALANGGVLLPWR